VVALLGRSGSGKSTLLRILAGLIQPSHGRVLVKGTPLKGPNADVAMVFQSFALLPWLTVQENAELGLFARGVSKEICEKEATLALSMVGLEGFQGAYPKELSGGMKQRVGFARALVVDPEVLFMDEPFSALDVLTAENLRSELLELWEDKKMPTRAVFIVTHNIEEAVLLGDRIVVLGKNPGRIRTDFHVDLPRPRDRKHPRFTKIVDYIYQVLTKSDSDLALPLSGPTSGVAATDARQKYPMLPHARTGGIAGFLEILADHNGREDVYRLADLLSFEIDDLLPIVEAAALLGFVKVTEGDVEITPAGLEFANALILRQKELFRNAALEHVALLKQIKRALESKSDHTLPDDFFHDILDEHFTEEETLRQLETAINWGRYAELFDHDSERKRFFIPEETPAEPKNVEVGTET
jgi:NitT/TauT family transport system ATP-binding protein